jgi:hypothetical protein
MSQQDPEPLSNSFQKGCGWGCGLLFGLLGAILILVIGGLGIAGYVWWQACVDDLGYYVCDDE